MKLNQAIKVPFATKTKVTLSLVLSVFSIILFYSFLFILGGIWIFIIGGVLPIIITLFFIRKPDGFLLTEERNPKLFEIINSVSGQIGTSPPKEVVLVPTTMIAVTGFFKKRMLIGLAALDSITVDQFRSIIAHEFGHFHGNDTVIGHFIAHLRVAVEKTLKTLNSGRNFFTLFSFLFYVYINLYYFVFNLTTMMYSRQKEYRSDLIAVQVGGSNIFSEGLLNYSAYSTFFENIAYRAIAQLAQEQRVSNNIYKVCSKAYSKKDQKSIKDEILKQKTKIFSTHPSTADRIRLVINQPKKKPKNKKSARTLFGEISGFEQKMSDQLSAFTLHKLGLLDKSGNIIQNNNPEFNKYRC